MAYRLLATAYKIYEGLSTDVKPSLSSGDTGHLIETDTGDEYTWNGTAWTLRDGKAHVDGKPRVSATPYLYDVVEHNMAGHYDLRKTGYNSDVDNVMEELWPVGGNYVFPSTGMRMNIVSSAAGDNATGSGARTLDIHYLDSSYVEQEETISTNGVTAVSTAANDIIRVQRFHVTSVGTNGYAAGDIDLRATGGTPIYARCAAGFNASQQCIWTVPANAILYITDWQVSVGNSSSGRFAEYRLKATCNEETVTPGVFQLKDIVGVQDGAIHMPFDLPVPIPSQADVVISVKSDNATANAICAGHFAGWYEIG